MKEMKARVMRKYIPASLAVAVGKIMNIRR
jgi:hypothetical protein